MANIKSAKKRILVAQKRAERNKSIRTATKTAVKKVYAAIESADKSQAIATLNAAISQISKACSKGVFPKKTASRKISRLSLAVNKLDK